MLSKLTTCFVYLLAVTGLYAQQPKPTRVPITSIRGPKVVRLLAMDSDGTLKLVTVVNAILAKLPDGSLVLTIPPPAPAPVSTPAYLKRRVAVTMTYNPATNTTQFDVPQDANMSTVAIYLNGLQQQTPGDYTVAGVSGRTVVMDSRFGNIPSDPDEELYIEYQQVQP